METIKIGEKELTKFGDASHSTKNENRQYVYCTFHEQRRSYCVCAGLVDAYLEKREWTKEVSSETSCVYAMRRSNCAAMDKRKLERKLNASLFYVERQLLEGEPVKPVKYEKNESYWRGWNQVGDSLKKPRATSEREPISQPSAVQPSSSPIASVSYADAINKALEEA